LPECLASQQLVLIQQLVRHASFILLTKAFSGFLERLGRKVTGKRWFLIIIFDPLSVPNPNWLNIRGSH
jgi:hypothetical protein